MNILIVGLGLIGGSVCKALKERTEHNVFGYDNNKEVINQALESNSIDFFAGTEDFKKADITIISLHPNIAESFIKANINAFKRGSILMDVCGIKGQFVVNTTELALRHDISYVGTHPMTGKEHFGFEFSDGNLFNGANFIVTPIEKTNSDALETIVSLAKIIGFGKIVYTSPFDHDKIIAYTSQLAHVVASAYVKSPTIEKECGFSGGSFQDMTRIATLNENMWANLFLENRECLLFEIDTLIENISKYREAIINNDRELLISLLKAGREIKENNLKNKK